MAFSPMFSKTNFTASDHYEFLQWVLSLYSKSNESVVAIIRNLVSTNKALANMFSKPLQGYASHRFNLAMKKILFLYHAKNTKVNTLMDKLKTLKLAGKLSKATHLRAMQKNVTRLCITAEMWRRYQDLKIHLADD